MFNAIITIFAAVFVTIGGIASAIIMGGFTFLTMAALMLFKCCKYVFVAIFGSAMYIVSPGFRKEIRGDK